MNERDKKVKEVERELDHRLLTYRHYHGDYRKIDIEFLKDQVGPGWSQLIEDIVDELYDLGWNGQVMQIKEKFGRLRFYIEVATPEMTDCILKYERLSSTVCEVCGGKGKLLADKSYGVPGGWYRARCKNHVNKAVGT